MDLSAPGTKSFKEVKRKSGDGEEEVEDYKDVTIRGYLSTWEATTKSDRQGDYVIRGAFTETIPQFMQNPVLLKDHWNRTENVCGSFKVLREDDRGLYVEAVLSNAPSDEMKDIRWKVVEGHLRSLSMGGLFHYNEDGRGIFKVNLWEGSLVPIPANPDALISTRSLSAEELRAVESGTTFPIHSADRNPAAERSKGWAPL